MKKKIEELKVVSLFSGIGGFDIGFEKAGFKVIWANDKDKYAIETYKANVENNNILNNNIIYGDIIELIEEVPSHDILIAGFPCQPFSTLGNKKGFNDKRGTLFFEITKIIGKHNTKIVVFENVKNLLNHDKGKTFKRMKKELESIGYCVNYKVLNTKDYGIPQRRNRIYIVAFKTTEFSKTKFIFPKEKKLKITTQDLLDKSVEEKYFLSNKILKTILYYDRKKFAARPKIDNEISKTLTATMNKMHRACQDNYITDKTNYDKFENCEKSNIRKLTPNECRKLQGFPNEWVQVTSNHQAYKQFGNAVSVNVAYEVANEISAHIKKYMRVKKNEKR